MKLYYKTIGIIIKYISNYIILQKIILQKIIIFKKTIVKDLFIINTNVILLLQI